MDRLEPAAKAKPSVRTLAVAAAVYIALGELSFTTALVETNTAAAWLPSGYAVGLLIVFGISHWPAVTIGSFILNALVNVSGHGTGSLIASCTVALCIAIGNTGEAVVGAILTCRLAFGPAFFTRSKGVALFVATVVPLAPAISAGVGVTASRIGGLPASGSLAEIVLTWYIANAVGLLLVTGPVVALLRRPVLPEPPRGPGGWIEAAVLACCIVFVAQAICGIYITEILRDWPKSYMIIPLLFWASFRFGTYGAFVSVLLVALISVVGTMQGFAVFPANRPSLSLIYLQIYLGMLSIMTLAVSAGLTEAWDLQLNLEAKVLARTKEIERYLREKDVFTTLIAHDLHSPLYGVRNALRAAADAIGGGRMAPSDLLPALQVMEETCSTLAERVAGLLAPQARDTNGSPVAIRSILGTIAKAHRLTMEGRASELRLEGDLSIAVQAPDQVEHILDALIDNAIKFSPPGSPITIEARPLAGQIEILVRDQGIGIAPEVLPTLFQLRAAEARANAGTGAGLGLYLAREQAIALGGDLHLVANQSGGACFCLRLPISFSASASR